MTRQIILNFHGIGEPHSGVDASERRYWISRDFFTAIIEHTAARRDVLYSFDDGNLSDLEIGAPLLASNGRSAAFFVLLGRLQDANYLTSQQIRDLRAMGMAIGLHGRRHVDWRRLGGEELTDETSVAREELQEIVKERISSVAIPFGAYDRRVIRHLEAAGFDTIYTSDGGPTGPRRRISNRTSIRTDMDMASVEAIIADAVSPAAKARRALSGLVRRRLL